MSAALVACNRVEFVDDNVTDGAELLAETGRGQQDEQRLRRGNQNMWWAPQHRCPFTCRRITRAQAGADGGKIEARLGCDAAYSSERFFEIDSYIVGECL